MSHRSCTMIPSRARSREGWRSWARSSDLLTTSIALVTTCVVGWRTLSEFGNNSRVGSVVGLLEVGLLERPEEVQQGQVQGPASGTRWPCATGQAGVASWKQLVATSCPRIGSVHLQQQSSTMPRYGGDGGAQWWDKKQCHKLQKEKLPLDTRKDLVRIVRPQEMAQRGGKSPPWRQPSLSLTQPDLVEGQAWGRDPR